VTSWRRMTSRSRHGLGTAGPPRPLQADTPVTWVTKVINAVGYRTSNGRFPKRENRSLVLRSAAQRSGGERSFYAPKRRAPPEGREGVSFSVWAHSDTTKSDHKRTHHTHKGKDARRSLDSGLPHSLRQSDRGRQRRERATRAVSKNKLPPTTPRLFFCFFDGPRGHRESFSSGAGRAARGDVVVSHDVTTCHGGMTTQQVLSEGGDGPR